MIEAYEKILRTHASIEETMLLLPDIATVCSKMVDVANTLVFLQPLPK